MRYILFLAPGSATFMINTSGESAFRELADSMPAIVWTNTPDGETDYLNQHYYEYTGLPSDVPGVEGWNLVVHPDDQKAAFDHYRTCFQAGVTWEQELRLKRADGQYRWHLSRSVPILDDSGKIVRWYATSTDIHEQKLAQAKAREEAAALETVSRIGQTLASELDFDRLVQTLTDAATELVGAEFGSFFYNVHSEEIESYMLYTISGVPRESFSSFPMPRNTEVFDHVFKGVGVDRSDDITQDPRYGKNPPYNGMPEGHLPVRSYLAAPVVSRSGEVIGGLFFGHSSPGVFTERHENMLRGVASQAAVAMDNARLYQRLLKLNTELEHRVEERTAALEAANKELEGFTYSVSHDLRAPLRAIMSTSMILREDYSESLPHDAQEQLIRQASAAKKMGDLIDELLRLSRVGRQEMDRREISLSDLAQESWAEMGSRDDMSLEVQPNLKAIGDAKLMKLVMGNLLDNASKFSPQGGKVIVGQEDTDRGQAFFVRDQGIGFDMAYADKMFLPFERLVTDAEFPGTGIGLANVRRIIGRHGGAAWAQGAPGSGATIYFTLPRPE